MEHILPYLAFLACPIGMGAMMFFMMKGGQNQGQPQPDPRLEELKREVEALRKGQAPENSSEYAAKTG